MAGHSHRLTLKNDHKPFKSKHATKGQLKNQHKGKVEKTVSGGKTNRVQSKLERKNLAKQVKDKKILDTKLIRKLFEGSNAAEKIVTVIPLTRDINPTTILVQLLGPDAAAAAVPSVSSVTLPTFKCSTKFVLPDPTDLLAVLDAAKVADFVVFGLSATEEVSPEYGEQILRAIVAQGVASVVGVLPNLVEAYPKRNLQADVRQSLELFFQHFFPTEERLYALEHSNEAANCVRYISQKFPKGVNWRDTRGYLVADTVGVDRGCVVVEGIVRGTGFHSNRLVHLPGHGDYQLECIEKVSRHRNDQSEVYAPDAQQESLDTLNPVEEEQMKDDYDYGEYGVRMEGKNYFDQGAQEKRRYKAPEGTSEYQSKWLLDDVLEGASDVEEAGEDDEEDALMQDQDMMEDGGDGDTQTLGDDEPETEDYMELSAEEEAAQLARFREAEQEEQEFPDEIELEPTEIAREKLKEYRGIKSLGSCDWNWDEYDSLRPAAFNRLLRVTNYKATKNKAQKDGAVAQAVMGQRVRLYIRAPADVVANVDPTRAPFPVYSLLEHEHKLAMTNFTFQAWEDYEKPVPSGEPLVVQYGFRRYQVVPTFSQASNNSNNVHKYQRFAHDGMCILSAVAPALMYNAPAIFFKQLPSGLELVGQGTFLNCDHTRVVAERVVLTGHAVKIHKRLVAVRYMFFNPEDINFFKAVPLFTKLGRTGFIKESLGTHGYFKLTFDGRLLAQDVIGMALYRRVWPAVPI